MLLLPSIALAATLTVGPSSTYATPCAAIAAAAEGDTIEVDAAGDYAGDTCAWTTDDLTIRGVAGQPVLDGTGADLAEQKGIFVVHAARARIENLAFVGAAVADQNGAGIRHQGTDLEVVDCLFRVVINYDQRTKVRVGATAVRTLVAGSRRESEVAKTGVVMVARTEVLPSKG